MPDQSTPLAAVVAGYQTTFYSKVLVANAWTRALPANPKRWSVLFPSNNAMGWFVSPSSIGTTVGSQNMTTTSGAFSLVFRDAPGLVTGEWWIMSQAGATIGYYDTVYIGG